MPGRILTCDPSVSFPSDKCFIFIQIGSVLLLGDRDDLAACRIAGPEKAGIAAPCASPFAHLVILAGIHYHVRSEGRVIKKAVYIAIGIDLDGRKDVLGMWVGENESARYWTTVLNSLRNRGVEDIFIACTDNLTGFSDAIAAVYPRTEIQNCIIHQLRNSSKYVSYKDIKALMADLKRVYAAVDEQSALDALEDFAEKWDKKYPKISESWRRNWPNLSTYFMFPEELRRLIYTTNNIEGFNHQLRKVTKSKSVFPTDDSLFKMLYLVMRDITKKWTGRRIDWGKIFASWLFIMVFHRHCRPFRFQWGKGLVQQR